LTNSFLLSPFWQWDICEACSAQFIADLEQFLDNPPYLSPQHLLNHLLASWQK
jgi:hypothetical protein